MIARWCISTFIFTLTLFGIVSQQQVTLPNQEIVLQFTDFELTSESTQHTIETVKHQLQDLGAENIKVKLLENGLVNIAYYTESDVASIKKTLSEADHLALDFSEKPSKEHPLKPLEDHKEVSYNLDVYEIQSKHTTGGNLDGTIVLEFEPKSDRFLDPSLHLFFQNTCDNTNNDLTGITYKICKSIAIATKNTSRDIPEVRAGPLFV